MAKAPIQKAIEALTHDEKRLNVPTAEMASLFEQQAELTGDVEREMTMTGELAAAEGTMQPAPKNVPDQDFGRMVLNHLRSAGVHSQERRDTIHFHSVEPWPGNWLAAEGRYTDGDGREKSAGILIGPEFGTLTRSNITAAAREASVARFDALIACAFNFEAQASDLNRLGPLPILKARITPTCTWPRT